MNTGENEQGLRKILDLTRLISLVLLLLHFYYICYNAFDRWGLTSKLTDRILAKIEKTGLFQPFHRIKVIAFVFFLIGLIGVRGRKDGKFNLRSCLWQLGSGAIAYFVSALIWYLPLTETDLAILYIAATSIGFFVFFTGGTLLSRLMKVRLSEDIFNRENESFPQEEKLLKNEFSVNLATKYNYKNKLRNGQINVVTPFAGSLVCGQAGSGKTVYVLRNYIQQHIQKGFCLFVYDFKFDDLSRLAYNYLLKYQNNYPVMPKFFVINFDDLSRTNRCNPLDPSSMHDLTDASESARTILMALNREWIKRQGDFFVESAITFVTANMWFLRQYEGGKYCTLPHLIELIQTDYSKLFSILRTDPTISSLITSFVSAFLNDAMEQLEGQVASARIAMASLASPSLYYVLTENEFTLDINNPKEPKIVCAGNNPQKQHVYGAVLSLYLTRLIKIINTKGRQKCGVIFDEFPTLYFSGMDNLLATARSNLVAATLGIQDFTQLKKDYGRDQAEVLFNLPGNIICGKATGDTAKQLSERIGKVLQTKHSVSINSQDTSTSQSQQMDLAVPPAKIAGLSSGEFVGMVADTPGTKIQLKAFHCEIVADFDAINSEEAAFVNIPAIRDVTPEDIEDNFLRIKEDIIDLVDGMIAQMQGDPEMAQLIVNKSIPEQ
jgi:hypothetical protein